jgi:hypothetical protein
MYTSTRGDVDMRTSRTTRWVGWIYFASVMMILSGGFSVIWGLSALIHHEVLGDRRDNLLNINYAAWGWIHLLLGIIVLVAGVFMLAGSVLARIVAVAMVCVSAFANLLVIGSNPWWVLIVIAVDVVIIYAITVHGHELR